MFQSPLSVRPMDYYIHVPIAICNWTEYLEVITSGSPKLSVIPNVMQEECKFWRQILVLHV